MTKKQLNKEKYRTLLTVMKHYKTSFQELRNIQNILYELDKLNYIYEEDEVIKYITYNNLYGLDYENEPNLHIIIQDMVEDEIL